MTEREFHSFKKIIFDSAGIDIRPHKKSLLINRLSKRLRFLGIASFSEYLKYVQNGLQRHQELSEMIDVVTTNKTDFYRESQHFTFLEKQGLQQLIQHHGLGAKKLKAWSSACSSGEEPYTLAIVLSEMMPKFPGWSFEILASDICETILKRAVNGVYEDYKCKPIPKHLLQKYFLPGQSHYKVKPQLGKTITFKKINLNLEFHQNMGKMNFIFCRNVLIYFNRETQKKIITKFWHVLQPGGFLFLGHSETLQGMETEYKYVMPSIYQKTAR